MSIQVVPCGTRVKTVIGDIAALVTGICIRDSGISYEISYFHNGEHKDAWVRRYEFSIDTQQRKRAGLVNYDKPEEDGPRTVNLLMENH